VSKVFRVFKGFRESREFRVFRVFLANQEQLLSGMTGRSMLVAPMVATLLVTVTC
jgi:hypothetical protein